MPVKYCFQSSLKICDLQFSDVVSVSDQEKQNIPKINMAEAMMWDNLFPFSLQTKRELLIKEVRHYYLYRCLIYRDSIYHELGGKRSYQKFVCTVGRKASSCQLLRRLQ